MLTEQQKTYIWKNYERQRSGYYKKAFNLCSNSLLDEGKKLAKLYIQIQKVSNSFFDERQQEWKRILRALYPSVIKEFGQDSYNKLIGKKDFKGFSVATAATKLWIDKIAAMRSTLIADSSKQMANNYIAAAVAEGKTVTEISKGLREFYDIQANYRAMRMARTEVVGSSSYGSLAGAIDTKIPDLKKTWVSSRDDRVRFDHDMADAQEVGLNDSFEVGTDMLEYPGDPSGSPAEIVHCRCALTYSR